MNELNENINMILLGLRFEIIKCNLLETTRVDIQFKNWNKIGTL